MARYHVDNRQTGTQQNIGSTYKSIASAIATGASPRRGRIVGCAIGQDGLPNATDCSVIWTIQRQSNTSVNANTATPNPLVPGDSASLSFVQVNFTSEPTYTLPVWTRTINQRASMQWTAPDTDASLLWPATASTGLTMMALSSTYASTVLGGLEYEDL